MEHFPEFHDLVTRGTDLTIIPGAQTISPFHRL
jgi:hypothetical protein